MQLLQITEPLTSQSSITNNKVTALGIDLGTTNSLVAYAIDQQPYVIMDQDGQDILPSIVAQDAFGHLIVGHSARSELNNIKSIKRLMGKSKIDFLNGQHYHYQQQSNYINYDGQNDLTANSSTDNQSLTVNLNSTSYTAEQISAEILKKLKIIAENHFGYAIDQAVITIPAYFDDAARNATIFAAKLAGLNVLRLISEPTAAAYAYGLDHGKEGTFIIYDFGGGTFDVSILNMQMGVFQVIATNGDTNLGGDDIDNAIYNYWQIKLATQYDITVIEPGLTKLLYDAAINAKKVLSDDQHSDHRIEYNGKIYNLSLSQSEFIHLIQPIILKTFTLIDQTILNADLNSNDIDGLILVGGSTRLKFIKRQLNSIYKFKIFDDIDPDRVVALGAALQAENLTYGSQNLVVDVTPLSLGLELMGNVVEKIIVRNTPIPCAVTKIFTTYVDNQTAMKFHILQGEREIVTECRSLAYFELKNIPPMKAGAAKISITFKLDADGILFIKATEETTGAHQQISLKPSYGLSFEQMHNMLMKAFENNALDHQYKLLQETIIEAEQLINMLKIAMIESAALLTSEYNQQLSAQLNIVTAAINSNDRQNIQMASTQLQQLAEQFITNKMSQELSAALKDYQIKDHST